MQLIQLSISESPDNIPLSGAVVSNLYLFYDGRHIGEDGSGSEMKAGLEQDQLTVRKIRECWEPA